MGDFKECARFFLNLPFGAFVNRRVVVIFVRGFIIGEFSIHCVLKLYNLFIYFFKFW